MSRPTKFEVHLFLSRLDENKQADDPFAPITWSRDCSHIMSDSSSTVNVVVSSGDDRSVSYPAELLKGGLVPPEEIGRFVQHLLDQAEIETGLFFLIDVHMVSGVARDLSQYGQRCLSIVLLPSRSTALLPSQSRQQWSLTWLLANPGSSRRTLHQAWAQLRKDLPRSLGLFESVFGPILGRDAMSPAQIAEWYFRKYLKWGHQHVNLQSWSELALVQFLEAASQTCMFEASEQVMSECLKERLLLGEVHGSAELKLKETGPEIQQTKGFVCRDSGEPLQEVAKRAGHVARFNIRTGLFDGVLLRDFLPAQNAGISESFLSRLPSFFGRQSLSSTFALRPPR